MLSETSRTFYPVPLPLLLLSWASREAFQDKFPPPVCPGPQVALTEGSFGPHQSQGEGLGLGQLTEHLGDLVVAAAHDGLVIDGLDAVTHAHRLNSVDDAALLDPLQGPKVTREATTPRFPKPTLLEGDSGLLQGAEQPEAPTPTTGTLMKA